MRRGSPHPDDGTPRWWPDDRWLFGLSALLAALVVASAPDTGGSETPAEPLEETTSETASGEAEVVPERVASIVFSHGKHAGIDCADCHGAGDGTISSDGKDAVGPDDGGDAVAPNESGDAVAPNGAAGRSIPGMSVCADCHSRSGDGEADGPEPELANCAGCHVGYEGSAERPIEGPEDWRAVRPAPMVPPRPQADLDFDHDAHVTRLAGDEGGCTTCHGDGDEPTMPTLETCQTCHGDVGDGAQPSQLKPSNHTVAWERRHGSVARASSGRCEECHTEDDCAQCHSDTASEPFSVHPPNFDTLHAVDARAQSDECAECHTVQTFCTQCHARANFSSNVPDRPPPRFEVHPPNWTTPNAAGNHAEMARRNINDCASCHTEDDCVSCHQGVDPHPPEFRLKCEQWLEANPAPCAKCHGDLGELRGKCL